MEPNGTELLNALIYTGLATVALVAVIVWWTRR